MLDKFYPSVIELVTKSQCWLPEEDFPIHFIVYKA